MSVLSAILIDEVKKNHPDVKKIILDMHFSRKVDLEKFNLKLKNYANYTLSISHVESKSFQAINIADICAGATLAKTRGNDFYYEMMTSKIKKEIYLTWRVAKSRFF